RPRRRGRRALQPAGPRPEPRRGRVERHRREAPAAPRPHSAARQGRRPVRPLRARDDRRRDGPAGRGDAAAGRGCPGPRGGGAVERRAQAACTRRAVPRAEGGPELPGAAGGARRDGGPSPVRAALLQRRRARIQHAPGKRAQQFRGPLVRLRAPPVLPERSGRGGRRAASRSRELPVRTAALLLLSLLSGLAAADERILEYRSDVLVRADASMEVTETITVRAEGQRIRRGIYRDYPTRYKDRFGNDVEVIYQPVSVLRDGNPEAFRSESRGNGVRTWFGSADRLLAPGVYTYTYRYRAGRMLGFFDEHDELYWNVTGLGWDFPIDRAVATVAFDFAPPEGALGLEAFTGPFGARGRDYRAYTAEGRAVFETTAPLAARQGLTIVVTWPKGYVEEPGATDRVLWLLGDNANLLAAFLGLGALFAYYVPVWRRHGRDPEPGLVIPRYEPPEGFSPASLRYIERMGYDDEAMTAAIINLAVKGRLRIDKNGRHV